MFRSLAPDYVTAVGSNHRGHLSLRAVGRWHYRFKLLIVISMFTHPITYYLFQGTPAVRITSAVLYSDCCKVIWEIGGQTLFTDIFVI